MAALYPHVAEKRKKRENSDYTSSTCGSFRNQESKKGAGEGEATETGIAGDKRSDLGKKG